MIRYIQFIGPVALPQLGGSTNWSHDKHKHLAEPEEKGSWVILHFLEKRPVVEVDPATGQETTTYATVRSGRRVRVPITNVGYIDETPDVAKASKS